jgi:membrane fusion protein, multidrug efflux system
MNKSGNIEPASAAPARQPAAPTAEAAQAASAKLRHAALLAAVLVIVGALAGLLPRWLRSKALRAETRELAIQTVGVVSPVPGKAAAGLTLPAEIKPLVEAPIYARTAGYLKRYLVDIGAQVKAGDLLAEIDTPELNEELAQVRAQLVQAEAALALAKTTSARWTGLLKSASVSEQEAAEKQADAQLKAATVEAAKANVKRLENLQSFERVTAPFAGTITARGTDVGQLIAPGSNKELFRLAQTGTLRVFVRVPQAAARGMAPGQIAELTIPELPGRVFPAKVVRTSGAMSADSRTLLTELEVNNAAGEILAGTYAQARFNEMKSEPLLTLPSNTLLFRAEGPQVGVVGPDGVVELRNISLGRDFGPTVEILGGVKAGDRVILNPSDSLVGGAKVRVVGETNHLAKATS